ncbi:hypothetical protein CYMTET_12580 [Cymbomonas tetramitiformis]|uniref:Uncharacterized protein n=1 Tax=Cymbomonas tetramitiformis TaxID=36881 RepID=A0AAE0LBX3_9CHLO|nr:hypothetical protein CYMTET_12580 [Cymbomonas tetramitiformis]|eukprot:gene26071-31930_t
MREQEEDDVGDTVRYRPRPRQDGPSQVSSVAGEEEPMDPGGGDMKRMRKRAALLLFMASTEGLRMLLPGEAKADAAGGTREGWAEYDAKGHVEHVMSAKTYVGSRCPLCSAEFEKQRRRILTLKLCSGKECGGWLYGKIVIGKWLAAWVNAWASGWDCDVQWAVERARAFRRDDGEGGLEAAAWRLIRRELPGLSPPEESAGAGGDVVWRVEEAAAARVQASAVAEEEAVARMREAEGTLARERCGAAALARSLLEAEAGHAAAVRAVDAAEEVACEAQVAAGKAKIAAEWHLEDLESERKACEVSMRELEEERRVVARERGRVAELEMSAADAGEAGASAVHHALRSLEAAQDRALRELEEARFVAEREAGGRRAAETQLALARGEMEERKTAARAELEAQRRMSMEGRRELERVTVREVGASVTEDCDECARAPHAEAHRCVICAADHTCATRTPHPLSHDCVVWACSFHATEAVEEQCMSQATVNAWAEVPVDAAVASGPTEEEEERSDTDSDSHVSPTPGAHGVGAAVRRELVEARARAADLGRCLHEAEGSLR